MRPAVVVEPVGEQTEGRLDIGAERRPPGGRALLYPQIDSSNDSEVLSKRKDSGQPPPVSSRNSR
jgi:hypothetical protein